MGAHTKHCCSGPLWPPWQPLGSATEALGVEAKSTCSLYLSVLNCETHGCTPSSSRGGLSPELLLSVWPRGPPLAKHGFYSMPTSPHCA